MLTVVPFESDLLVSVYLLSAAFADFRLKKQEVNATFNLKLPRASKGDNLLGSAQETPKEELITPPSAVEPDGALPLQVPEPPVVETPQEVVEPPPEVVQIPQEVVQVPQEVVQVPQEVAQVPQEVVQVSPEVVEPPQEVVEPPQEVEEPPQPPETSEVDNVENKEPERIVMASPLDYNPNPHS